MSNAMDLFARIRRSLTLKISIIMVLLVMVPFGIGSYFLININQTSLQGYILELHSSLAKSLVKEVDEYLKGRRDELKAVARLLSKGTQLSVEDINLLTDFINSKEDLINIIYFNYDGEELFKVINKRLKFDDRKEFYKNIILKSYTRDSHILFYKDDGDIYLFVGANVHNQGVLVAMIQPDDLNMVLSKEGVGKSGFFTLIREDCEILVVPTGRENIIPMLTEQDISSLNQFIQNKTFGSLETELSDRERMIFAFAPSGYFKGGILLQQPYEEAYYSSITMRNSALISVVIGGILAIGVAIIFAHNMTRPIRELAEATDRLARGEFPIVLKTRRRDEIGQLMERFNETTERLFQDDLTGKHNRRLFYRRLQEYIQKAREEGRELSLLIVDIDGFKGINDTYGHTIGDEVLKNFSDILQSSIRDADTLFRYAGDEFIVILDNSPLDEAIKVSERIMRNIEKGIFKTTDGIGIDIKASIGISKLDPIRDNFETIFNKADKALYFAKELGGDKVYTYEDLLKVADRRG
jgi:diguanylate cyclase (GGDEF)-like protein